MNLTIARDAQRPLQAQGFAVEMVETGFLTGPEDRRIIVDAPQVAAEGIASGVHDFLRQRRVTVDHARS